MRASWQGLVPKYNVERRDDPAGKHADCQYFVLDPTHDKFARQALAHYAEACREDFPVLAADLEQMLADTAGGVG